MKKIILIIIATLSLFSCEKDTNQDDSVSIELYYYGRSILYYTFEIPVKIYEGDKVVLDLVLWSMDSTLAEGKYTICPQGSTGSWPSMKECVTNTYSYTRSYLEGSLVTGGDIEVSKSGDMYSFAVNLKNEEGKNLSKTYTAKVTNKISSKQSPHQGFFSDLDLTQLPEKNHMKANTTMCLIAGDYLNVYGRQIWFAFCHTDKEDPTGRYTIGESNVKRAYHFMGGANPTDTYIQIVSGWFEVKRRDKLIKPSTGLHRYIKFTVDVDVMTEAGEHLKGSYINGDYSSNYE